MTVPFVALAYGKDEEVAKYHESYGLIPRQIRISAGLEDEPALIEVLERAMDALLKDD